VTAKGFDEGIAIVRVWHDMTTDQERDLFLRFQSIEDVDWLAACKRIIHSAFPPKLTDWERYVGEIVGARSTAAPFLGRAVDVRECVLKMKERGEKVPKTIADLFIKEQHT